MIMFLPCSWNDDEKRDGDPDPSPEAVSESEASLVHELATPAAGPRQDPAGPGHRTHRRIKLRAHAGFVDTLLTG